MIRRFLFCLLQGERFSPALAVERTALPLVDANEPGEVVPSGRYAGVARAQGSALLPLLDDDVAPGASLRGPLHELKAALPTLRALGATEATLSLLVAYDGPCHFAFSPEELAELAALGLPLDVSCHPGAA
ncbi:hypothetical protein [Melittangium boletus]|uniref:hypothetical protein n=1 Tax=Melittangium boletus TaxID=83453 RepID=UPI003DA6AF4F